MTETCVVRECADLVSDRRGRQVGLYFSAVTLITGLGDPGGLVSLPILFILKEQLGKGPKALALFEAIIFLPVCLGFIFGFLRDRWKPMGMGDRGYLVLGAPMAAACYLWFALDGLSYSKLLTAILVASIAYQMIDTAMDALMTSVAQRHLMTGRLSALTEAVETVPSMIAVIAGGWMVSHTTHRVVFVMAAAITASIAAFAAWRPQAVFESSRTAAIRVDKDPQLPIRLLRHAPMIPAVLVLVLWNFSPGFVTPLFYYLTDIVRISGTELGVYKAVGFAAVTAASLFYGLACQRHALKRLLFWSVLINIFPGALFLFMNGPLTAIVLSAVLGLVAGFANVAFFDLLRRSCPEGMEGMGTTLGFSAFSIAGIAGDLVGAFVYERGGFVACLVIDALMTVLILPVLRHVPHAVSQSRDGESADSRPESNPAEALET